MNYNEIKKKINVLPSYKIHYYVKHYLTLSIALITFLAALVNGALDFFIYVYLKGKCTIWKVDISYMDTTSKNYFYKLFIAVIMIIVVFTLNYILYKIMSNEKNKVIKRIFFISIYILIESIILFFYVFIMSSIGMSDLIKVIKNWGPYDTNDLLKLILLILIIVVFLIDIYAFAFKIVELVCKHISKKENLSKVTYNVFTGLTRFEIFKVILITFFIAIVISSITCFLTGKNEAINRNNYSVITEETENEDSKYTFTINEKKYNIYVIVYNDQKMIIGNKIGKNNNEVYIDNDMHKIFKGEIEIVNVDDYRKLNNLE